jgi:hypothetical protein
MNVRRLLVPVMVAMAALAGCTSSGGPKVATAQGTAAAPSGGPSASASAAESDYDKALRFTRCMTDNGVKLPDPVEGKPLEIAPRGNGWAKVSSPAFEKCRHLLPATWPVKADPELIAQARPWGECMRKHGVDTPELTPDANGMVHTPPDPTLQYTPEWIAAEAACRQLGNPDSIPLTDG